MKKLHTEASSRRTEAQEGEHTAVCDPSEHRSNNEIAQCATFSLADVQNESPATGTSRIALPQVGIEGFKLPLSWGPGLLLETTVTASISVPADQRGGNLSRLTRGLYAHAQEPLGPSFLKTLLAHYCQDLGSPQAFVRLCCNYPLLQHSLRSGLSGYQYYPVAYEGTLEANHNFSWTLELHYAYSSTCPSSDALAEQARAERNVHATPHAQRSLARVRVQCAPGQAITPEALLAHCQKALPTPLQVIVKRSDEQAFAELNGSNLLFVEDAIRRLHHELTSSPSIATFQLHCQHFESLHAHNAFAQF